MMLIPTIEQIRAARALLDWSQSDLAERADLSQTGIARIENGTNFPNSSTLNKIRTAFENEGIEFINTNGVQRRTSEVRTYQGHEGFIEFLNDVHKVVSNSNSSKEVFVNNVSEDLFLKWEKDFAHVHQARMEAASTRYKIIIKEGDKNYTASKYAEYRQIPADAFGAIAYYLYGNRTALIDFGQDNVHVYVIHSDSIANFYKAEFNLIWGRSKTV